jgi:hypothetical protein
MANKTFKIGEYAKGGIIQVVTTKNKVTIIGKEWDFSSGSSKSSDQSKAKEFTRLEVNYDLETPWNLNKQLSQLEDFLSDLTTYYYTDEIMKWIKSNSKITKSSWN